MKRKVRAQMKPHLYVDYALLVSPRKDAKWDWERPAPGWLELMVDWLEKRTK
jgi:hypothetical protein